LKTNCTYFFSKINIYNIYNTYILFTYFRIYIFKLILFLFIYLFINCIILTLQNVEYINLTQNIQIVQSLYIKLTLGYVKNFEQELVLTQV